MRRFLNDKRFVGAMSLLALLLCLWRFLPREHALPLATKSKPPSLAPVVPALVTDEIAPYVRPRWLPSNGERKTLGFDPFNREATLPSPVLPAPSPSTVEEQAGPVDTARLIVEALGLDEAGFFVRYRGRRVREGDQIGAETLGKIAISGLAMRNDESYRAKVSGFIQALSVDGDMLVEGESRIVLDGRAFRPGDILRKGPWVAVLQVQPAELTFIDEFGNRYAKPR